MTGQVRSKARARRPSSRPVFVLSSSVQNVGAGLPAMQAIRYIRHTQLMSSQASQLPQENAHASSIRSAVRPPRFAFDFDLGRPPNPCRITGMPSLGEAPSVGARAFCLLLRSSKVSRRKGGTISRRYPNNGYVRSPPQTAHTSNSPQVIPTKLPPSLNSPGGNQTPWT